VHLFKVDYEKVSVGIAFMGLHNPNRKSGLKRTAFSVATSLVSAGASAIILGPIYKNTALSCSSNYKFKGFDCSW
jgi:hypothetical protein